MVNVFIHNNKNIRIFLKLLFLSKNQIFLRLQTKIFFTFLIISLWSFISLILVGLIYRLEQLTEQLNNAIALTDVYKGDLVTLLKNVKNASISYIYLDIDEYLKSLGRDGIHHCLECGAEPKIKIECCYTDGYDKLNYIITELYKSYILKKK